MRLLAVRPPIRHWRRRWPRWPCAAKCRPAAARQAWRATDGLARRPARIQQPALAASCPASTISTPASWPMKAACSCSSPAATKRRLPLACSAPFVAATACRVRSTWYARARHGWWRAMELLADSPHTSTPAVGCACRFRAQQHAPLIDLQTDFHDGDAAFAHHSLPGRDHVTGFGRLAGSLDRLGRVTSGSAPLHGSPDAIPRERGPQRRVSRSCSITADLRLDHRTSWPPIDALQARVKFTATSSISMPLTA